MPRHHPTIGDAIGYALAHNARLAARHNIDRMLAAHDLETELTGGCGICDTEHDEMCAACHQCRCHRHDTCTRPPATA